MRRSLRLLACTAFVFGLVPTPARALIIGPNSSVTLEFNFSSDLTTATDVGASVQYFTLEPVGTVFLQLFDDLAGQPLASGQSTLVFRPTGSFGGNGMGSRVTPADNQLFLVITVLDGIIDMSSATVNALFNNPPSEGHPYTELFLTQTFTTSLPVPVPIESPGVPEPTSAALVIVGFCCAAARRWRLRQA